MHAWALSSTQLLFDHVILVEVTRVMVLHNGLGDVLAKDLRQVSNEVLGGHGAVLVLMLGVAEGRVEEQLHEAAEFLLAQALC